MAFLLYVVDFLLCAILSYDTLSFLYYAKKRGDSQNLTEDYSRLVHTWIFYMSLKFLSCFLCSGFLGGVFYFVIVVLKAYVILPVLKGTPTLKAALIDQNVAAKHIQTVVEALKAKMNAAQGAQ